MGIEANPDDGEMNEIYSMLEDGDESVSIEKLKSFFRKLFTMQMEQLDIMRSN